MIEEVNGTLVARQTAHQAIFSRSSDAAEGTVDLLMPDGKRFHVRPGGLIYTEFKDGQPGKSAFIAELNPSQAELTAPNRVTYARALDGADLHYDLSVAGLDQSVVIHERLPNRGDLGIQENLARLEFGGVKSLNDLRFSWLSTAITVDQAGTLNLADIQFVNCRAPLCGNDQTVFNVENALCFGGLQFIESGKLTLKGWHLTINQCGTVGSVSAASTVFMTNSILASVTSWGFVQQRLQEEAERHGEFFPPEQPALVHPRVWPMQLRTAVGEVELQVCHGRDRRMSTGVVQLGIHVSCNLFAATSTRRSISKKGEKGVTVNSCLHPAARTRIISENVLPGICEIEVPTTVQNHASFLEITRAVDCHITPTNHASLLRSGGLTHSHSLTPR